jgi:catechol 2,3-dioxygenase-like lactoylglutathione lyase family enzyme
MARIRHIAIFARDQEGLAAFYKTTFGMQEVFRHGAKEGGQALYLSDGAINLAILPARGSQPEGLHHFGFEVESVSETAALAESSGGRPGTENLPRDGRFAESFVFDPAGARVDLSEKGWQT